MRALSRQPVWWPATALFLLLIAGLAALAADPGASGGPAQILPAEQRVIRVHVSGAVAAPGDYQLAAAASVGDAIAAAGGLAPDAGSDSAMELRLFDGASVFVGRAEGGPPSRPQPISHRIDLNRASAAELVALPGIGPGRAQALIEARAARPVASLQDVVDRGIWPHSAAEQVQAFVGVAP